MGYVPYLAVNAGREQRTVLICEHDDLGARADTESLLDSEHARGNADSIVQVDDADAVRHFMAEKRRHGMHHGRRINRAARGERHPFDAVRPAMRAKRLRRKARLSARTAPRAEKPPFR